MNWDDSFRKQVLTLDHVLARIDGQRVSALVERLVGYDRVLYFTGVGKNGHVAAQVASTFNSLSIKSVYVNPVDCLHGDIGLIDDDSIIVATSKSGNTEELYTFLHHIRRKRRVYTVLLHCNPEARCLALTDYDVLVPVEGEADHLNVVPTASLIAFSSLLYAVCVEVADRRRVTLADFVNNHPGGAIGQMRVDPTDEKSAQAGS